MAQIYMGCSCVCNMPHSFRICLQLSMLLFFYIGWYIFLVAIISIHFPHNAPFFSLSEPATSNSSETLIFAFSSFPIRFFLTIAQITAKADAKVSFPSSFLFLILPPRIPDSSSNSKILLHCFFTLVCFLEFSSP
jgi:hypothetical protein